jgi:hypothetical protein
MKISHECPIALLEDSRKFNDYSYALVHLLDQYPKYYEFFKQEKLRGRHILLDNSIFELGVSFESDKFPDKILEIQPTEYIVPDVLEDMEATIRNFEQWLKTYNHLPGRKIGVVQGKNFDELSKCYAYMAQYADKIAISFDYSAYFGLGSTLYTTNQSDQSIKLDLFETGRQRFIDILVNEGKWSPKPHHLLGAARPREFKHYVSRNIDIDTIDTSNPVVNGLLGIEYDHQHGVLDKPSIKLADLIDTQVDDHTANIVIENARIFRTFVQ